MLKFPCVSQVQFLKVNGSNPALREVFEDNGVEKVPFFFIVDTRGRIVSRFSASLSPEKFAVLRREIANASRMREAALVTA